MKLDRMIGILAVLLQKEKVTAPWLAEKFEVSRRTINRDIERLCMAGIPIVTTRGAGGGISIMEGYVIDRTLLTSSDMQRERDEPVCAAYGKAASGRFGASGRRSAYSD